MSYLVDTNVLSEARRPERGNPKVVSWLLGQPADQLFISVITILELRYGVVFVEPKNSTAAADIGHWLDNTILPNFAERTLPIDTAIALRCAALHVPQQRPYPDALIAATALVHDLTVVTRNTRDFKNTGVRIFSPWDD